MISLDHKQPHSGRVSASAPKLSTRSFSSSGLCVRLSALWLSRCWWLSPTTMMCSAFTMDPSRSCNLSSTTTGANSRSVDTNINTSMRTAGE
jgi:hypothetical protein